ncbi:restriction endonuclease subunit S [Micromonospora craniellae]|uniref:Restriction endonuclease subunit S n=2 Tax=Micromonospora craniellae TaxID=2294034 RepID=A0A372FQT6_9ACTN|nr:restriction endonuclease subunit S [Micromonospora craniellae]
MKAWQGSLAISRFGGIVSPDYLVCRTDPGVHTPYLHYLLRSSQMIGEFKARSKGIRPAQWRLYWEDLADISIKTPSLDEQRRIAKFLDAETARIDRLDAAIRQQVTALSERRLRTLDSVWTANSAALMMRLGYGTQLVTSGSRGWADFVGDSGTLFFRSANLRRDSLQPNLASLAHVKPPPAVEAEVSRSRIRQGDVLVGITGANTGWVALADHSIEGGNVSQHVCLVRPSRGEIDGRWLAYLIASPTVQTQLLGSQYGGTKTQLSLPDVRDIRIPIITIARQREAANRVDEMLRTMDRQRELRKQQLAVLAERRQALITAAVTGQIDVATANARSVAEGVSS